MQPLTARQPRLSPLYLVLAPLLLVALVLAACGRLSGTEAAPPAQLSAELSTQPGNAQNATVALQPASGYGGLYVQVSGSGWPRNMMVLVTLEDEQGRSETLAASDTDAAGNLNTGFLFPIDERWMASDSVSVVSTTADGSVEAKAPFTIVPPGTQIASTAPSPTPETNTTAATSSDATAPLTETTAMHDEQWEHTVVLPLISSVGPERGSNRASRGASSRATSTGDTKATIEIASGSIDCRNADQWITVVIYSSGGFDATSVDPGSVTLSNGSDLSYGGDAELTFAAYSARNRRANQWQWHMEDVNGDGAVDLVMEFRVGYVKLDCSATAIAVTGRTKDGRSFQSINPIKMRARERS